MSGPVVALVPKVDKFHPGGVDELPYLLCLQHLQLVHFFLQFTELCRGMPLQILDLRVYVLLLRREKAHMYTA